MLNLLLSNEAYYELKHILNIHSQEYNCLRLCYIKGCCKSSTIDIYLDNLKAKEDYIIKYINNIPFIYNEDLANNITAIEIIYTNSSFMMKITPNKNCSNCNFGCKSNCNSCNN